MPAAPKVVDDTSSAPRTRKGATSRARLVDAARRVFEEDGFLDARITDIAERAGLGHGTFYHYFDSKEAILREVAAALADRLVPPVDQAVFQVSSEVGPREQIRQGTRIYLERYKKEARLISEVDRAEHLDVQLQQARRDHSRVHAKMVAASIRQHQRNGLADPRLDPNVVAHAMSAIANRFADLWAMQKLIDCSFEAAVEQLTLLMCNAIGVPDEEASPTRRAKA